jgi:TonB family protein
MARWILNVHLERAVFACGLATLVAVSSAAARADEPTATVPEPRRPALSPPELVEAPDVSLPEGSAPLDEDASVELLLLIGTDGAVSDASVAAPVRDDVDAAVLAAVPSMRFRPATRDGQPIAARVRFRFVVLRTEPPADADLATPANETGGATTDAPTPTVTASSPPSPAPEPTAAAPEPVPAAQAFAARARIIAREPGAASRVTLTGAELTTVPGTFGEPLRVVATLPGVARSPFGLGFFLVRGAAFENTGFFVDGFPVPLLYHLGAGPAVISSRLVDQLDFYPGGYPASYGRFNAGIISLRTAPPPTERPRFEAELDIFRGSVMGILPFADGKGSVAAAFRRSYYELILPLVLDGFQLSFTDYQLRVDYRPSPRVRTSLFFFGSQDRLDVSQSVGAADTSGTASTALLYRFHRVIGKVALKIAPELRATFATSVGYDETSTLQRNPGRSDLFLDAGAILVGQRADLVWNVGEGHRLTLGVDALTWLLTVGAQVPQPPGFGEYPTPGFAPSTVSISADVPIYGVAPYVEERLAFGPLELVGALRLDAYRYGNLRALRADPRFVVRYKPIEALTIKAATGLFSQQPQPFQLLPGLGNDMLRPSRSWQTSAGIELTLPWNLYVESQGFYTQMSSLVRGGAALVQNGNDDARQQFFFDDGEGRAYGFELLVRRKVAEGFYGWLSYTLSRSERFLAGRQVLPFLFDQTHVLNFAASYQWWRFRFGARFQLATGRPTQEVVGAVYDADDDDYRAIRTGLTGRLPAFHQLDLRVDYEFPLGPTEASIYVEGINIYNQINSEGLRYQFDFARQARLPGLPALGTVGFRVVY